jgi:hypothetical protein
MTMRMPSTSFSRTGRSPACPTEYERRLQLLSTSVKVFGLQNQILVTEGVQIKFAFIAHGGLQGV